MKTRTVYIVVYYRNAGNFYTREAMTPEKMEDYKKYGDHFLYFGIQSDQNLQRINDTWYAEVDTMHPELVDWRHPEFPVMAGCIRRGKEAGGFTRRSKGPKPCPFTGIYPELESQTYFGGPTRYRYFVVGRGMTITTEFCKSEEEALEDWNRRAL